MANPTSSDDMPSPPDVFVGGDVIPLGSFRFDKWTATDSPVGPEPESPPSAPQWVGGNPPGTSNG